ncbi:16S rRNA (uracil(1498)-N(3))-methyltransferase [Benzoatithermus flavus]|uniref:Ribosomal RNA small subunit methyltransferase E n=1 Tax=Benzoatithermus flavus TaxID=3108223 RepID=A0ABU8XLL7_9PROT
MTVPRLHLPERLAAGATLAVVGDRAHYLRHVLRLKEGDPVHAFNAGDGEWRAVIKGIGRHEMRLEIERLLRPAVPEPGPTLAFAPIRRNRLEWLVEKAVELGVARLVPVITQRTVVKPEKADRLAAIATEAAEQCERLTVPPIDPPRPLPAWLAARAPAVPLFLADERGEGAAIAEAWHRHPDAEILIGPEGGFAPEEVERLRAVPGVVPVTLGPRILRAETAALYALVGWQIARPALARISPPTSS